MDQPPQAPGFLLGLSQGKLLLVGFYFLLFAFITDGSFFCLFNKALWWQDPAVAAGVLCFGSQIPSVSLRIFVRKGSVSCQTPSPSFFGGKKKITAELGKHFLYTRSLWNSWSHDAEAKSFSGFKKWVWANETVLL